MTDRERRLISRAFGLAWYTSLQAATIVIVFVWVSGRGGRWAPVFSFLLSIPLWVFVFWILNVENQKKGS